MLHLHVLAGANRMFADAFSYFSHVLYNVGDTVFVNNIVVHSNIFAKFVKMFSHEMNLAAIEYI